MNGDGNGYYKPNDAITRAEFATMINRAFGYDTLDAPKLTGYTDVPGDKWYANEVATIAAMGYMVGYGGGRFGPEHTLTWEQAGIVLGKIMRLDSSYPVDKSGIITRGETAQLINDAFGVIVDSDLFITEGVGDGDVYLENIKISGRLLAAGGGENSIHVNDVTVGANVVVDKPSVAGETPRKEMAMNELKYVRIGDYLLPCIRLSDLPDAPPLGRYGMMHKEYLHRERPALYATLLLTERLYPLCREVDEAAAHRLTVIGNSETAHEFILLELVYI